MEWPHRHPLDGLTRVIWLQVYRMARAMRCHPVGGELLIPK
jgi:hypothetical protein